MARQTRQFPQGKYVLRTPHDTKDGQVYAVYLCKSSLLGYQSNI